LFNSPIVGGLCTCILVNKYVYETERTVLTVCVVWCLALLRKDPSLRLTAGAVLLIPFVNQKVYHKSKGWNCHHGLLSSIPSACLKRRFVVFKYSSLARNSHTLLKLNLCLFAVSRRVNL